MASRFDALTPGAAGVDPCLWWGIASAFHGDVPTQRPPDPVEDVQLELLLECDADAPDGPDGWPAASQVLCEGSRPTTRIYSVAAVGAEVKPLLTQLGTKVHRIEFSAARRPPGPAAQGRWGALSTANALAPKAKGNVLVVIDTGFAFLHEQFRSGTSTRIRFLWDQNTAPTCSMAATWTQAAGFDYGRELTGGGIDALLAGCKTPHDEKRLYEALGFAGVQRTLAHGTQVAGWACEGLKMEHELILVQLPSEVAQDTSGAGTSRHVADALVYALAHIDDAANVVVNISFGSLAGPHDGSTLLEQAMDAITAREQAKRNFAIVLPTGNAYNGQCHAQMTLAPRSTAPLYWQVGSNDPTESFCELWYSAPGAGGLLVSLESPQGGTLGPVAANAMVQQPPSPATAEGAIVHRAVPHAGARKSVALCCLAPTRPLVTGWAPVPAGVWKIWLQNTGHDPVTVDAWIQRDEPVIGDGYRSRQSRFIAAPRKDDDVDTPSDPVQRRGTGNSLAHGSQTLVVGGAFRDGSPVPYSSMRPAGFRQWPDLITVTDANRARPGLPGIGTQSGTRAWMNGTSIAAPQVAAQVLELFAGARFANTQQIRARLLAVAKPPKGPPFRQERCGGGFVA